MQAAPEIAGGAESFGELRKEDRVRPRATQGNGMSFSRFTSGEKFALQVSGLVPTNQSEFFAANGGLVDGYF
jgi:hypothetical protein